MDDLQKLADLLHERNRLDAEIARLVGRPASRGHIGEFIASRFFGIDLEKSAANKAWDGRFKGGSLAGKTVNVKWYAAQEGILDIRLDAVPDYYLVLTGPKGKSASSKGGHQPLVIDAVFLFEAKPLVEVLKARGGGIGEATSIPKGQWEAAEVCPRETNKTLVLDAVRRSLLGLFGGNKMEWDNDVRDPICPKCGSRELDRSEKILGGGGFFDGADVQELGESCVYTCRQCGKQFIGSVIT